MHGGASVIAARILPSWVIAVTALVLGALGGVAVTLLVKDLEISQLRETQANARLTATVQHLVQLKAAIDRGDQLTRDLHQANASTLALQDRLDHEIEKATTGRACLGTDALRLLDRAAAGPNASAPPPGKPAATHAGEPAAHATGHDQADAVVASDTDVARWANAAYAQYAQCAQRLNALIDWHTPTDDQDARP